MIITWLNLYLNRYKSDGEVDLAYVYKKRFWPVEVKWSEQLRPKDLKQILKYKNSEIYAKLEHASQIEHVPVRPLVLALLEVGEPQC